MSSQNLILMLFSSILIIRKLEPMILSLLEAIASPEVIKDPFLIISFMFLA